MAIFHWDHFALMELIWEFKTSVSISNFFTVSVYFVGSCPGKKHKAWHGFADPYKCINNTHFFLFLLAVLTIEA